MTALPTYQASPIKRARATKAEVEERREALLDIIEAGRPMTDGALRGLDEVLSRRGRGSGEQREERTKDD